MAIDVEASRGLKASPANTGTVRRTFSSVPQTVVKSCLFPVPKTRGYLAARLNVPGYRWAPKSFVFRNVLSRAAVSTLSLATADENGLRVSFPGLEMAWNDVADGKRDMAFTISQDWDHWYSVSWIEEDTHPWSVDPGLMASSCPAIILEKDIAAANPKDDSGVSFSHDAMMAGDMNAFTHTIFLDSCDGAFVVAKEQDGVLMGALGGRVVVSKRQYSTFTRPAWEQIDGLARHGVDNKADMRCFEKLSGTQRWCVG